MRRPSRSTRTATLFPYPTLCRSVGMGKGDTLPGEVAFKLYDTFGFPYDLTEDALRTQDIGVDRAGFDAAMAQQKAAARAAWKGSGEKASDEIWFDQIGRAHV